MHRICQKAKALCFRMQLVEYLLTALTIDLQLVVAIVVVLQMGFVPLVVKILAGLLLELVVVVRPLTLLARVRQWSAGLAAAGMVHGACKIVAVGEGVHDHT
eukprot:TRINITY_DN24186_c0_g1_i1.p3 TRINITY_DN24186_c0_g1~~TRINITY_DN24186_c0_g1_i1.p3  ORF type:complete len:102 (-),score=7.99 TRINITY_DN24186_c0_g1_i1:1038-1343(-)